jgi:hypothetical protein
MAKLFELVLRVRLFWMIRYLAHCVRRAGSRGFGSILCISGVRRCRCGKTLVTQYRLINLR